MANVDISQIETVEMAQDKTRQRLLALLAEMRWRKETSGVNITEDAVFQSDRTTRTELASLITNLSLGTITAPVTWKALSGWEVLGEDQLRQTLWLINEHVQACFVAEKAVATRVTSRDLMAEDQLAGAFETAFETARNSAA